MLYRSCDFYSRNGDNEPFLFVYVASYISAFSGRLVVTRAVWCYSWNGIMYLLKNLCNDIDGSVARNLKNYVWTFLYGFYKNSPYFNGPSYLTVLMGKLYITDVLYMPSTGL